MCTLSLFPQNDELIITMNRDEKRSREEGAALHITEDYAYPVDLTSQGTWIGMNNNGLSFSLLNRYQDTKSKKPSRSRGIIIPDFLTCQNIEEASLKSDNFTPNNFNAFDFFIINFNQIIHLSWNEKTLTRQNIILNKPFFFTSSSVDTDNIINYRTHSFLNYIRTPPKNAENILLNLHLQQNKEDASSSIFMAREETHTKSITQIQMSKNLSIMHYWPQDKLVGQKTLSRNSALTTEYK